MIPATPTPEAAKVAEQRINDALADLYPDVRVANWVLVVEVLTPAGQTAMVLGLPSSQDTHATAHLALEAGRVGVALHRQWEAAGGHHNTDGGPARA